MIVRIQTSGGSFLGAGKYYLHDKSEDAGIDRSLKPKSDERVWFTDTRNCLSTDPERAFEEMWRTAEDQAFLKMQAGVKRGGRVCEDPVKTLSLSWHKDDRPTPEHMIESADAFLKHMGWDGHQAVLVGHNDTEHRHIHVILNRVNHENGRTLDDYREQKRAQVWALTYEKQQDNIRCEERELRAAKREHRAPDLDLGKTTGNAAPQPEPQPSARTPANDHLPHNVIMIGRPHEQAFKRREETHEAADRDQRATLKAEQRAEREAFFKDGAKVFKAVRHAVYDEVRKDYAPEWRQFYKDSVDAARSAEAWSAGSVSRALYFAKDGGWQEANNAFADRNSVRDAVTHDIAEHKADLKARQTDDLRERQRDACDALREVREVQYRELLQRQQGERAAINAGETLDSWGMGRERSVGSGSSSEQAANENRLIEAVPIQGQQVRPGTEDGSATPEPKLQQQGEPASVVPSSAEQAVRRNEGAAIDLPSVTAPHQETIAPASGLSDLIAGGIGGAASYLADQLGELFAPTPPAVREAQAKDDAKRDVRKTEHGDKAAAYARIIDAAVRAIETERANGQGEAYWKDRDRGKGWERDQ